LQPTRCRGDRERQQAVASSELRHPVSSGTFSAWIINIPQNLIAINLDATYAWDNEGRMTSLGYPADQNGNAGSTDTYTYDAMGRLSSMGATWNPDGTLATFNGQTRTYNSLGQLTQITGQMFNGQGYFTGINMQYNYVAGQNNGRISSTVDGVTGETVNYTYDSLNRLATAASTNGAWGNAYTYDGWGNLTAKTITQGTAPTYSANPDPSRNGGPDPTVVDPTLDVEGRTIAQAVPQGASSPAWTYDPAGKMVFYLNGQWTTTADRVGDTTTSEACEFRFYGITGQRLGRYTCSYSRWNGNPNQFNYTKVEEEHKTAGILTGWGGKAVTTDRLGSIRADGSGGTYSYYPYGEVKTAPSGQTGLFADLEDPVRVYDSNGARFTRPDPLGIKAADPGNPATWNRFVYANGDPINFYDPPGTNAMMPGYCDIESNCGISIYGNNYVVNGGGGGGGIVGQTAQGYVQSVYDAYVEMVNQAMDAAAARMAQPPDPNCVQDAISTAAGNVGLNLGDFTGVGVQIVGTANGTGGTYGETELNLTGSVDAVAALEQQMCNLGFYNNGGMNGGCLNNNSWLVGTPHSGYSGNFRSSGLTNSVQVNTGTALGANGQLIGIAQIDVDPYNPAASGLVPIFETTG